MKKVFILLIFLLAVLFFTINKFKVQAATGCGGRCPKGQVCKEFGNGTHYCVEKKLDLNIVTDLNFPCDCKNNLFGSCKAKWADLTNVKTRNCSLSFTNPDICNAKSKVGSEVGYIQYVSCSGGTPIPTVTPGGPTLTPTPDPQPTDNPNCKCNAVKNCTTQCQFDKFSDVTTYSNTIKCGLADTIFQTAPTADNKTSWCRAEKRTKGDADGDGSVTFKDYFYYVTAKLGFKIPPTVNPDFNGDNIVDTKDKDIIIKSLM